MNKEKTRRMRLPPGHMEVTVTDTGATLTFAYYEKTHKKEAVIGITDWQAGRLHQLLWKVAHRREAEAAQMRRVMAAEPARES